MLHPQLLSRSRPVVSHGGENDTHVIMSAIHGKLSDARPMDSEIPRNRFGPGAFGVLTGTSAVPAATQSNYAMKSLRTVIA